MSKLLPIGGHQTPYHDTFSWSWSLNETCILYVQPLEILHPPPAIIACPASVHMVKPLGDPIASLRWLMNQIQFSVVSESKTSKQTGYNHLCPSTSHALANCPLYLPVKNVLSIARYGLQPTRNPSMHGFNAKKNLLNLILSSTMWWSIMTKLSGQQLSTCALNLNRLSKLES